MKGTVNATAYKEMLVNYFGKVPFGSSMIVLWCTKPMQKEQRGGCKFLVHCPKSFLEINTIANFVLTKLIKYKPYTTSRLGPVVG